METKSISNFTPGKTPNSNNFMGKLSFLYPLIIPFSPFLRLDKFKIYFYFVIKV